MWKQVKICVFILARTLRDREEEVERRETDREIQRETQRETVVKSDTTLGGLAVRSDPE